MKKIFFIIIFGFLFHQYRGFHIPRFLDDKNIIDIGQEGYLFKVEKVLFKHIQKIIFSALHLFEQLKRTRTGKAIIGQVSS